MEKYSQVFKDVADFLNEHNWIKESSFLLLDGKIKCSAFGAVKARTVPAIAGIIEEQKDLSLAVDTINRIANLGPQKHSFLSAGLGRDNMIALLDEKKAWDQRSPYIRIEHIVTIPGFPALSGGTSEATYLMGMAGLTGDLHDAYSTQLYQVKEKLLRAAVIAKELGV